MIATVGPIQRMLSRRWLLLAALAALAVLQSVAVFQVFPMQRLDLPTPWLLVDHALHHYDTEHLLSYLSQGRVWGYDPNFMAGYPTALVNFDSFGVSLAVGLLSRVMPLGLAQKVVLAGALIALPLIMIWIARNLGARAGEALLVGFLTTLICNAAVWLMTLLVYGLVGYVLCILVALLSFSLAQRYINGGGWSALLGYVISAWFCASLHPLGGPQLALLLLLQALLHLWQRQLPLRKLLVLLGGGLLAAAGNLFWIWPLLRLWHDYHSDDTVQMSAFGLERLQEQLANPEWSVFLLLLLVSLLSPVYFLVRRRADLLPAVVCWLVLLGSWLAAYFDAPLLGNLEPARFLALTTLLMPLLAAKVLHRTLGRRPWALWGLVGGLLLVQGLSLHKRWGPGRAMQVFGAGLHHHPELASVDVVKCLEPLSALLREQTDRRGRILFQDSFFAARTCGAHYHTTLVSQTHRFFIGGPYHLLRLRHHFASMSEEQAFGGLLDQFSAAELAHLLALYNIRWVVVLSDHLNTVLRRRPQLFEYVGTRLKHSLYRYKRPSSYFIEGGGRIEAGQDRITIREATAGPIVIKYHYLETLITRQGLPVTRAPAAPDPVGFIRVDNRAGHRTIEIINR